MTDQMRSLTGTDRHLDLVDVAAPTAPDAGSLRAPARNVAFEDAYREHSGAVFGLARRLLGDCPLAEDITQEVFLRLWSRPDRFDPTRGRLRTFLLTDCHGRSIDAIRSEAARRRREERDGRAPGLQSDGDVGAAVSDAVDRPPIDSLLQALPDSERVAIALAFSTHITYQQVAAILDVPEGTVKGRIRSGLRRLRTQVDAHGTESA